MDFKEMTLQEQEHYIIKNFTTAVKVSKTLPRVGPKSVYGIYTNVSDRSAYDNWDESILVKTLYNEEEWTIFEKVLFEWRNAFIKKNIISPIWKRLWVIFDETYSLEKKIKKLGISKTYVYSNKQQGIELIRQYLIRRG